MRIIPVIDLRSGRAVRGRSGDRARYRGVESRLVGPGGGDASDPARLLEAYRRALRPGTIYVADLDRLEGTGRNDAVMRRLLALAPGARFLLDGGFDGADAAAALWIDERCAPVLGTETLRSIDALALPPRVPPAARPVLSLDLKESGVLARSREIAALPERTIAARAAALGVRTVIALFLDRVGSCDGLPHGRVRLLRESCPGLEVLAGGGIADLDDLERLRDAGCSGALLGTALHDGRIRAADLERRGFLGPDAGRPDLGDGSGP